MPTHFAVRRTQPLGSARGKRLARYVNLPTVGQCFEVETTRVFDGWLIRIPEVDGTAHAVRRFEVESAARDCIAARTGIPLGYIAVVITDEIG